MASSKPCYMGVESVEGYKIYRKKYVYVEWISFFILWLLFAMGLASTILLKGEFLFSTLLIICGLILIFSLLPFLADLEFYLALWMAVREGKEIILKAEEKGPLFTTSLLGSKEIWIKESEED